MSCDDRLLDAREVVRCSRAGEVPGAPSFEIMIPENETWADGTRRVAEELPSYARKGPQYRFDPADVVVRLPPEVYEVTKLSDGHSTVLLLEPAPGREQGRDQPAELSLPVEPVLELGADGIRHQVHVWHKDMKIFVARVPSNDGVVETCYKPHIESRRQIAEEDVMRGRHGSPAHG